MIASKVASLRTGLALATAFAAGTALPGIAAAQTVTPASLPPGALLIVDDGGRPIGVLVPEAASAGVQPASTPQVAEPDPMAEMMALQGAMMRQMQGQMAALEQAANRTDSSGGVAASLVIRSVTTGPDGCSRTVVWRQSPSDATPKMVLDQVADRCAAGGKGLQEQPSSSPQPVGLTVPGLQAIVDVHAPAGPRADRPF